MSALPARRRPTYADIEALPEHLVGEILAGELVVSPRPAFKHARASSMLGHAVGGPFDAGAGGPGGWWIVDEPELHLDADREDYPVVVPDLAGWRRERMPEFPDVAACRVTPDWICEVLSPGNKARDRAIKLPFYARAGVRHVWLVSPDDRTLEVFRLDKGSWVLAHVWQGDARVRAEPFDTVELSLGLLWIPAPATPTSSD